MGMFILSSTIRRHRCSAVLASLRNQQSIAFVKLSPGTQRFDVHRSPEVTSAQTGHERCFRGVFIFQGNSPNQLKSGVNPDEVLGRPVELRVQAEIKGKSRGSYSFPGCNFLVRSHVVWPESDTQLIGSKTARFPPTWG